MLCLLGFDQLNIFLLLFCTHIKKVVTSVQNSHYGLEKMIGILISFADFCFKNDLCFNQGHTHTRAQGGLAPLSCIIFLFLIFFVNI